MQSGGFTVWPGSHKVPQLSPPSRPCSDLHDLLSGTYLPQLLYETMEHEFIPSPTEAHRPALQRIVADITPYEFVGDVGDVMLCVCRLQSRDI